MCWRKRVYSLLHGLREEGGLGGAPICNEGAPFEEGCEGDFARDFLLRVGEDTFILFVIVIVLVIVTVRKQSVKAEQQRSTKAEKQRQRKAINKKKQQAIKAGKSSKRKLKEKSEADSQRSRKAEKQHKRKRREAGKAEGSTKKY